MGVWRAARGGGVFYESLEPRPKFSKFLALKSIARAAAGNDGGFVLCKRDFVTFG